MTAAVGPSSKASYAAEAFYGDVLQKLRTWKPAPPKLKKPAEMEVAPETAVAELVGVEPDDIAELPSEIVDRGSATVAGSIPNPPVWTIRRR